MQSIEIWLGHNIHSGCDIATLEQMMLGEGLQQVEREENVLGKGIHTWLSRPTSEPQYENSYLSVTSQIVSKMPKFSTFSRDPTQKGEVLFEQWVFEMKSMMQSHKEATLQEGMIQLLCRAVANLVQYLGPQALVSEIIIMLELIYGTMVSFDILMLNFYKLQQGNRKEDIVCILRGGGTECGAAGISTNVKC